jgi:PAS domain S-box-containing protein
MSMERHNAGQALINGEQELHLLMEAMPVAVWRAGPEGDFEYVNQRLLEYLGAPLSEILGWGWMEKVHPDDATFKARTWLKNLESGNPHDAACRFRGADGQYRWFAVRAEPTRARDGRAVSWCGVLIDIDDQRRAEGALRESEYKLRQIIEAVPSFIWSTGLDGEPTHVNQRLLDYSGMRLEEFKRTGWEAVVHPDDFQETARAFHDAIHTGISYQGVVRLRRADGEFRWHHARFEPLHDRQGSIIQCQGVTVDIAEGKKAEEWPSFVAQLRATLNVLPAQTWYASPSGGLTFVNNRTADYLGLPQDHPLRSGIDIGAQWNAHVPFLHPDDREGSSETWSVNIRTGEASEYSFRVRDAQGGYRWFLSRVEPLRDNDGTLMQWVGVNLDIEELKRTEQALQRSQFHLSEGQRLARIGSWAFNPSGFFDHWSHELFQIYGLDPQKGAPTLEQYLATVHPLDRDFMAETIKGMLTQRSGCDVKKRIVRPDGDLLYIRCVGIPFIEDEVFKGFLGSAMDITEQELLTQELERRQAYLAEAQRLSNTGSAAYNEKTLLYWSDETYRILGFDLRKGLPSRDAVAQRTHPDDQERVREQARRAVQQKRDYKLEYRIVLPARVIKHIELTAHPKFSASGELMETVCTLIDVTERKRAEEALRESQAKFRDYAESASDWFWEIGPDYKFTMLTENAFGLNAADRIGTACWDRALDIETEPEKWRLARATLEAHEPFRDFVYCSMVSNGSPMYVKASGKPVFDGNGEFRGYRGTGTDVTATIRAKEEHERLRQLESDLAHMNRLGVMGELAASLIHEITQPIGSARNNARAALNFLDRHPPDLGEVGEALGCVVGDADRAGEIVDRIRAHIKKAAPRKDRFDLNEAITEVIELARSAIAKNGVSVETRLVLGALPARGDRVQLQQVVLNLILNAVEAMSSVAEGARRLLISTEKSATTGVLVAVRDSGPGIVPERRERVFDAFYTTKSSGMGMGLSICRSIIVAHGGRLWAAAIAPHGTVFQFTLPNAESSS